MPTFHPAYLLRAYTHENRAQGLGRPEGGARPDGRGAVSADGDPGLRLGRRPRSAAPSVHLPRRRRTGAATGPRIARPRAVRAATRRGHRRRVAAPAPSRELVVRPIDDLPEDAEASRRNGARADPLRRRLLPVLVGRGDREPRCRRHPARRQETWVRRLPRPIPPRDLSARVGPAAALERLPPDGRRFRSPRSARRIAARSGARPRGPGRGRARDRAAAPRTIAGDTLDGGPRLADRRPTARADRARAGARAGGLPALPALRRDRLGQDRGLPPGGGGHARGGPRRALPRSGDRSDPAARRRESRTLPDRWPCCTAAWGASAARPGAARHGRGRLVVGTRSAVFAPIPDLGLIVVDEEQDGSYKQDETPRYNARDLAVVRGPREGAVVLLGSATPSMESFQHARSGRYGLLRLGAASKRDRWPRSVVDMREEYRRSGAVSPLSSALSRTRERSPGRAGAGPAQSARLGRGAVLSPLRQPGRLRRVQHLDDLASGRGAAALPLLRPLASLAQRLQRAAHGAEPARRGHRADRSAVARGGPRRADRADGPRHDPRRGRRSGCCGASSAARSTSWSARR